MGRGKVRDSTSDRKRPSTTVKETYCGSKRDLVQHKSASDRKRARAMKREGGRRARAGMNDLTEDVCVKETWYSSKRDLVQQ